MEPISTGEKRCAGVFEVIALLDERPQLRSHLRHTMAMCAAKQERLRGDEASANIHDAGRAA
jgi:hypothetical protein